MTAKIEIKKGARISYGKNGYRATRVAHVTEIAGDVDEWLFNAITDAQLPDYGDAYPAFPGITLNNLVCDPLGGGKARVVMSYSNDDSAAGVTSFRISSSTSLEQVEKDQEGNRLQAHFRAILQGGAGYVSGSRLWTAEVERPSTTMDFSYQSSVNPYSDLSKYQGTINSVMFNGNAAGTVLCSFSIDKSGDEYDVRLSFSVNPNGWEFKGAVKIDDLALPLNPSTAGADTGLDHHTGIKQFNLYPVADFTALDMDIGIVAASVTGTSAVHPAIDGADINDGGKTIILTLYNDTWAASGSTFDAQRQNIIDGITSNRSEDDGWDAEIALGRIIAVANVVRTSDTVVTITFAIDTIYAVTERETITTTIPATALVTSSTALDAKPTFSINPEPA
jgi:hypothetical protein